MSDEVDTGRLALVIEDNEDHRYFFKGQLEAMGYSVEVVEDIQTSIEMIEKQEFDLILLDMQLPNRNDGLEILDWMYGDTSDHKNKKTKIVVVSVRDDFEAIKLATEKYQVNHYLVKPVDPDVLEKVCTS